MQSRAAAALTAAWRGLPRMRARATAALREGLPGYFSRSTAAVRARADAAAFAALLPRANEGAAATSAATATATAAAAAAAAAPPAVTIESLVLTPGLRPNASMYALRVTSHPERLRNLYFTFLFALRALHRARPVLERLNFSTGRAAEDAETRELVLRLAGGADAPFLVRSFDESAMFRVRSEELIGRCPLPPVLRSLEDLRELQERFLAEAQAKRALREAFRAKFHNISRIMDCVGCEKCRLWGKLQFLGVGTALKVLFAEDEAGVQSLTRNEVVALVTVLHRLSMSVAAAGVFAELAATAEAGAGGGAASTAAASLS